jgi:hypothetical protein
MNWRRPCVTDANGGQLFQVARGGLALGHVFLDQVANAGGVQAQGGATAAMGSRACQRVKRLLSQSCRCHRHVGMTCLNFGVLSTRWTAAQRMGNKGVASSFAQAHG